MAHPEVVNAQELGHLLLWTLTQSSVFMSQVHWTKGPHKIDVSLSLWWWREQEEGDRERRVGDWGRLRLPPGPSMPYVVERAMCLFIFYTGTPLQDQPT